METVKFQKRVINVNDQERMNLVQGFKNEATAINDFWLRANAELGSLYSLGDIVSFIEDLNLLYDLFYDENKSKAIEKAKTNGISVEALSGLDAIPLTKKQSNIIQELKRLGQFSMFKNGLSSQHWLIDGEIQVTEKVEEVFEELTTEFTKAPIASSRLNVLEAFEKHIDQFPEDKLAMIQVIRHGRKFVNYGL